VTDAVEAQDLDWGEDWQPPPAPETRTAGADPGDAGRTTVWSIVLVTYSDEGHREAAANVVEQLPTIAPELGAARVHTTSKGSMVVYGRYDGPQNDAAQRDLKWVKEITMGNRRVFPRAILSRINLGARRALHPHALRSVRLRHPNVDPLYTLEVALWGDFESGKLAPADIRRRAEAYANELRAQGFEAYFHHDDDKRLSMVTVGVFDRTVIDPRSGFYGPAVEALLQRFPAHLVNGELLYEPIDRYRPARGTRVQRPMLVHVPKD
jgi:hypothetical protein